MNIGISLVSPVHGGAPVYLGNRGELERPWKKARLLPLLASMFPAEDSKQSPRSLEKLSPAPGLSTPQITDTKRRRAWVWRQNTELWKGSNPPGSSPSRFPDAPGFKLATACFALSHLRAQRGSAGRARTSQAAPGRSGRELGARRCPRPPGLRIPAAALTRRSSRALSTRRAIAPSPPPRPTLGPPVPFHAVPSARSPGARIRLLPRVPASPCGARAARPQGAVPGVAATGKWRWGIRGGGRRLATPARCRLRTWDRDVPGWGL